MYVYYKQDIPSAAKSEVVVAAVRALSSLSKLPSPSRSAVHPGTRAPLQCTKRVPEAPTVQYRMSAQHSVENIHEILYSTVACYGR